MKQQRTSWLQQTVEQIWYENSPLKYLLLPLSALFCLISKRRRVSQESQQQDLGIPVIVVGNISVGGTGKTPLVIRLVQLLQQVGHKPAIITRGYKGTSTQWPLLVDTSTDVKLCGDEAKLMALRTSVPVVAGADRVADIEYVQTHTDATVVISDDGMQHYRMKRNLEIAVIDAERRFGNGHCLPAGPLRERPERLNSCDLIISNGRSCAQNEYSMEVFGDTLVSLDKLEALQLNKFDAIQVVTGIGNPQRFIDTLQASGTSIKQQYLFPDHHIFATEDFATLDERYPIVMTEKDAVKCTQLELKNAWYLPVEARLESAFETAFLQQVKNLD